MRTDLARKKPLSAAQIRRRKRTKRKHFVRFLYFCKKGGDILTPSVKLLFTFHAVFFVEFLNTSVYSCWLLLACIERMAFRTDFNVYFRLGGSYDKGVTAVTTHICLVIFRMYPFLHSFHLLYSAPICLQIVRLGANFSSRRSGQLFRPDHSVWGCPLKINHRFTWTKRSCLRPSDKQLWYCNTAYYSMQEEI